MQGILLDLVVVLLIALLAAKIGAWVFSRTPIGIRRMQARNRRLVERARSTHCPRHGDVAEQDLVRLPSGETLCPKCYEEIYHADLR